MITRRFGGRERWYLKSRTIRRRNFLTCCKGFVRLLIYLTKSLFELTANCQESKQFICYELPSESVTNFTKTTFISKHDSNHLQSLLKIIGSKQKFWILGTETFSWSSSQRRGPTPLRRNYKIALYKSLDLENNNNS